MRTMETTAIHSATAVIHSAKIPWEHDEWRDWAACKNADTNVFFEQIPVVAESICGVCPVAVECLDYAMREYIYYGMWGGKTAHQRRSLRSQLHRDLGQLLVDHKEVFDDVADELAEKM